MNPGAGRVTQVLLLLKVGAFAAVGGVLAMAVLLVISDAYRGRLLYLVPLALVVAMLCMAAVAVLPLADAEVPEPGAAPTPPPFPWREEPVRAMPDAVVPARPQVARGPQWYDDAARSSAALHPAAPHPAGADARRPPLSSAAASVPTPSVDPSTDEAPTQVEEFALPGRRGGRRRVVQCPRCAHFDLDVWPGPTFAFRCRGCRHAWRWTPGAPWPATVVRPALAETRPPSGSA